MDSLEESPFSSMLAEDLTGICASSGFQILRSYLLSDCTSDFCSRHASSDAESRSCYLLHRDILHAMLMPVAQLFKRASELACAAPSARKQEDQELAFRGEARDAFVWLQCFLAEEEDWCRTEGCPACVLSHTLSTEFTIRATIAAALLSSAEPLSTPSSPTASSECSDDNADTPECSPSLPDFSSTLPALSRALAADSFWGADYYTHILSRAERLLSGIRDLIAQCAELEALGSPQSLDQPSHRRSPPRGVVTDTTLTAPPENRGGHRLISGNRGKGMNLKKGKMARRQSRLKREEHEMMVRMAWQAWADAAPTGRRRTLTCP